MSNEYPNIGSPLGLSPNKFPKYSDSKQANRINPMKEEQDERFYTKQIIED